MFSHTVDQIIKESVGKITHCNDMTTVHQTVEMKTVSLHLYVLSGQNDNSGRSIFFVGPQCFFTL